MEGIVKPKMTKIVSTSIDEIGYDPVGRRLWVMFTGGTTGYYSNVTPSMYDALLAEDLRVGGSIGSMHHATVKKFPKLYPWTKVS